MRRLRLAHPGPSDVLFLVEVAESSLRYDREDKLPTYARAGVPEVWLIDVAARRLEVHTQPGSDGYARIAILRGSEEVAAEAMPQHRFGVSDLLG